MTTPQTQHRSFLFSPITTKGFGLMRISWAITVFFSFLFQWKDLVFLYSNHGVLPDYLHGTLLRTVYRFSILDYVADPSGLWLLYILLLVSTVAMAIGIRPRLSTIVSVLLVFSFNERNPLVLGGGDTLLRHIGFFLMIAPNISAFSLSRSRKQWLHWKKAGKLLSEDTMSIWPYRLLLWQMIIVYGTSLWFKSLGSMWWNGTAAVSAMHHPTFTRFSSSFYDYMAIFGGSIDYMVLALHVGWIFLLVPKEVWTVLPKRCPRIPLKQTLLLGGFLFHGGILILMDAGSFSLAVFTAYLGLLLHEDFSALKQFFNKHWHGKIVVLFDGGCGLCRRSVFSLELIDHLGRLRLVDFRKTTVRKKVAPKLTLAQLDRAMHIAFADGRTLAGFDAFRALCWHIPLLWITVPLLYIPGVPQVGRVVYKRIADSRKKCSHEGCKI